MIATPPRPISRLFLILQIFILPLVGYDAYDGASSEPALPQAVEGPAIQGPAAPLPSGPATEDRAIDQPVIPGASIESALSRLYRLMDGREIDEVPLEEILAEGAPSLSERHVGTRIRLRDRYEVDSLLARPEIHLSVFMEGEEQLSSELWSVHFAQHGADWKAERFEPLLTAHLGYRFALREDEVYAFERLTIERPAGVMHLEDGLLMPGYSGDRVGRAVLVGTGPIHLHATGPCRAPAVEQVRPYKRRCVHGPVRPDGAGPVARRLRESGGRCHAVARQGRTGIRPGPGTAETRRPGLPHGHETRPAALLSCPHPSLLPAGRNRPRGLGPVARLHVQPL